MKKVINGGFGVCLVLAEDGNIQLVCAPDTKYNPPFAVVEDYNADFQCWSKAGYYSTLHSAIEDYDNRILKLQQSV